METIAGIVGLIFIVTFFVMAGTLSNISKVVRNSDRIISAWSRETGIGLIYKCKKCNKHYEGRLAVCPNCGDPKTYV